MKIQSVFLIASLSIAMIACSGNEDEIDTQLPVIDMDFAEAFPKQCDVLERGETYEFTARFIDNFELGSYSLDIHHNFDQHTHSTEVNDCTMDPVKTPVNPWLIIEGFPIPSGQKEYLVTQVLEVPEDIDPGDYHFMIKLTDKEGWQTIRGISIKVN
ncbi:DUF4625 domain-containing protein [Algoriphagus sp. NG3]|uniref:DUF4625 domain-containing protein n=1 Tax=unclassified Algoriphagus TaxID=2641541 RepID=UPI002A7FB9B9|nr:DUF4625 domain-containing protein [Algoriphagus sp. NG3]WPR75927.1 DUF4625 domain-containing protein [Algoriphagus sp. NG3]